MARIVLAVIGLLYIMLGIWCAISPKQTSEYVGFHLNPGEGQSEFFTVYGGLEFALGLVFLIPLLRTDTTATILLVALIVHATLVVFRMISFALFQGVASSTYGLAGGEVVMLIALAASWWSLSDLPG
ncbi:hypothetical protein Pla110_41460 [Polystyrenella longa]|uniref:DUF4345 domain-containing protein n=1 Tax=Polystyrenella longa TaxID=2528007 RepID=A0A518CT34_9PLAN|nr:DUF4345 family protein [Polystyrenella longa]QDU82391.1 hypothetical protein Pla110_41460 [Polystyrenella longa]